MTSFCLAITVPIYVYISVCLPVYVRQCNGAMVLHYFVLVFSSEVKKKRNAFAQKKDSGDDDAKDEEDNKNVLHADPQSKGERRGSFFHNVEQQVASLRRQSVSPQLRWQVAIYCKALAYM